ncbi:MULTISPECIES: ammonium transporter [Methanobacterium]|jgi:Amt family ammonium transporter|uniref:Ammonium transporter n=1 Tax=Methanobacterium veterum TaxID=408577 RepID=A0A9E4ZSM4_9EURY|nr:MULTISPECIES: ammonium transporter [Methanobacterium]MCZ3364957.1 ammonium transporter [Methanobacterium veterum]MCZ3372712.1 ammonium transporter [Methanobacterium veterum]
MILDSGDTAWMLISTALVILMTIPGVALFYGGLIRKENVLNTMLLSFVTFAIVSVLWFIYGYDLTFGADMWGVIGSITNPVFNGVLESKSLATLAPTIPTGLYAIFQMTFAAITVALISGAVVERMKFSAWLAFVPVWLTLVYVPVAHWMWGGGFLAQMGALDFAGGIVVHLTSGIAALALVLVLGARKDIRLLPHHLGYSVMGAGLLWFGWFGFNAGSALSAGDLAVSAMIVTNTSAAVGMIAWMLMDKLKTGKPTLLGALSGAIAGLASITPAAGYVNITAAIIIGFFASIFAYNAVSWLKPRLGYDDALDVFGIHGICGITGAVAIGIFANPLINSVTTGGILFGNFNLLGVQLLAIAVVAVYSFVLTVVIAKIIDKIIGLRVTDEHEVQGLDVNLHEESGYRLS